MQMKSKLVYSQLMYVWCAAHKKPRDLRHYLRSLFSLPLNVLLPAIGCSNVMSLVALVTAELQAQDSCLSVVSMAFTLARWTGFDVRMITFYFKDNSGLLQFGSHFLSFGLYF